MWDNKNSVWQEDEWLCRICEKERTAKDILLAFAQGQPFDDGQEDRITRYFGKRRNQFAHGKELKKGDPNIAEHEWMRYARFEVG